MEALRLKASIPYSARLALIASVGDRPAGDIGRATQASDFRAYCAAIGTSTVSDSEGSRRELEILIEGEASSDERRPTQTNGSGIGGRPVDHEEAVRLASPGIPFDMQTAHYSMALKEYGDKVGREARYEIERSPTNPLLFSAHVHVDGSHYQGLGRTKKQAKHLANRAACQAIGTAV